MNSPVAPKLDEVINIWPSIPPEGPGPAGPEKFNPYGSLYNISTPRMVVHRPINPTGLAILVLSGGGYVSVGLANEGRPTCVWLASQGITAFELVYRLPDEGWKSKEVAFQDAQRAMRLIRSQAVEFGIDPERIGVLGFSAGGHLAGITATKPDVQRYPPIDKADTVSARPSFAALFYPVLTMYPPFHKTNTRFILIGDTPTPEQQLTYSVEKSITAQTPRMFIAHSLDDPISVVEHALVMTSAMRAAQIPTELHVFQSCGHGWGMGQPNTPVQAWPQLFKAWCIQNKFLAA